MRFYDQCNKCQYIWIQNFKYENKWKLIILLIKLNLSVFGVFSTWVVKTNQLIQNFKVISCLTNYISIKLTLIFCLPIRGVPLFSFQILQSLANYALMHIYYNI